MKHNVTLPIWRVVVMFALPLVFIVSCSSSNNASHIDVAPDKSQGQFALPQSLQAAALPNTPGRTLRAYLTVDSAPRQEMTINDQRTQASVTLSGLSIAQHTFKIEFELDSRFFPRPLPLVSGEKSQDLVAGSNELNFTDSDYNRPSDTDRDGVSNVDEVIAGTNPFSCVVGTFHIGDCQL
jgi:hypothetical protein